MKSAKLDWCLVPFLSLILVACGSDSDGVTEPPPESKFQPTFIGSVVSANPNNTISASVEVQAVGYDSVFLSYWRDGGSVQRTPTYPFESDTLVNVPVLGLDTASTYHIETNLIVNEITQAVDTSSFQSGSLPAWIPPAVAVGSDTTPGFLTLSYPDGPVIVNNTGKVVWYLHSPDPTLVSFHAHGTGRYTLFALNDSPRQFKVLDELGNLIGTLSCIGFQTRFHDILVLPEGDYWIMCDDFRIMDLSSLGASASTSVRGTVIQHLGAQGQLLFEWNAFDHLQITDLPAGSITGANSLNFTHGNSVDIDIDGNLLVSFRSLNEITKINLTNGNIMWRFGGVRNQFTIQNDSKGSFERQHGLRRSGPGQIQFLDNGLSAPSRFVRYLINPVTMTATLVMDFRDSPTTVTPVGGGTQYYDNGYGLVSFGRAGRVIETDPVGNRAWELTGIDNVYVYRAQRVTSLYPEQLGASSR